MKENKNISGFKTPENYFESFEERLYSKLSEENFPKSAGFKAPDGYFDNLGEQILKTVIASEKPAKVIQLFPKKYFGYAAAIAASVIIGFTVFNTNSDNSSLDSLQLAAIDTYIEDGNLNLDIYDLTTFINDEDITDLKLEDHQFSETTLENYILENVDEETLINEQ
ncbi:hypothetical protein [Aequorivita antarctica]|uniref:Uncharacterized protein n=1 Tax=Aequorivita antarctica TaxID=153266 RepID=A0A5C6Z1M4_9FLAO|nr:hypothetical protein [Aequorivita antarctica]TXD73410.1 hypothetical protein ESU54_06510 [Aequorivita antarctica]SRX76290.1 hypothetical protein AEQU3_03290 [Aequorivita antarctica]